MKGKPRSYEEHMAEVEERKYVVKTAKTAVAGMTDGLLVMFSFVAGISGALGGRSDIILLSGLIALVVESLVMGAVQFVMDKTEREVVGAWSEQELNAVEEIPEIERRELVEIYLKDGLSKSLIDRMMSEITSNKQLWVKKMLMEELGLQLENLRENRRYPIIMAATTAVGGVVPLIPLIFGVTNSLYASIGATSVALFILGGIKSYFSKVKWYKSALETTALGVGIAVVLYFIGFGLRLVIPS